jgi:shikimate dehydrogenase
MKQFGLIGYPLKNTFSENYFNSKFLSLGLMDYHYQNFPLTNISELAELLVNHPNLKGLNVTLPYKEHIIPMLSQLDESALLAGAVNCIKITGTQTIGYNTDVYGFEGSLIPFIKGHNLTGALVLGNGGAAKAVKAVLTKLGIKHLTVTRTPSPNTILYSELTAETIQQNNLLINCTPAGMFPNTDEFPPIPYHQVTHHHLAYDLIYLPVETEFLKRCKQQGAHTKNGLEMLHLQADKSWEIWFD